MKHLAQVSHAHKSTPAEPDPNRLWLEFIAARGQALATLQIEDATRAGEAWADFLYSFAAVRSPPLVLDRGAQ